MRLHTLPGAAQAQAWLLARFPNPHGIYKILFRTSSSFFRTSPVLRSSSSAMVFCFAAATCVHVWLQCQGEGACCHAHALRHMH